METFEQQIVTFVKLVHDLDKRVKAIELREQIKADEKAVEKALGESTFNIHVEHVHENDLDIFMKKLNDTIKGMGFKY